MNYTVDGNDNIVAGNNVYIQRAEEAFKRLNALGDFFKDVDRQFEEILGNQEIVRGDSTERYSSEKLFGSLVQIGIPVSIAIDVPRDILHYLRANREAFPNKKIFTANDIKNTVLRILTGLHYQSPYNDEDVQTWSTAYVRRYGNNSDFIQVVDNGNDHELSYEYVKERFLPHLLGKIIGLEDGVDVINTYHEAFSGSITQRMATEIIKTANSLNLYSIRYKTLYNLMRDVMLEPPHPWIVNETTRELVHKYNAERMAFHHDTIVGEGGDVDVLHVFASAWECAAHASALLLTHYNCLLGVESRYGLIELIRICQIKNKNKNLVLWDHCLISRLPDDLKLFDMTLKSFVLFLERTHSLLSSAARSDDDVKKAIENCGRLVAIVTRIIDSSSEQCE